MAAIVGVLSVSRDVGVVSFELERMVISILKGTSRISTTASSILLFTVNELLLRETLEMLVLDKVSTFQSSGGGESPA